MEPIRIWIVNSYTEVPGGCCPDLPDSSWTSLEAAQARVKQLYEEEIEFYKEQLGITEEDMKIEIKGNFDSAEIDPGHGYWCEYYVNGSVPLCDTLEQFDSLPVPFNLDGNK